jgi:hypothetical protein
MADNSSSSPNCQLKSRKRWRWLAPLVAIAILPVAHFGWLLHETWRFDAAVEAIHARGEPVLIEDFNHPPHSDPENPAPLWCAAAAAIDADSLPDIRPGEVEFPLTRREASRLRELTEQNEKPLALARSAASKTGPAEWDVRITSPVMSISHPELRQQGQLLRLLVIAAYDAHQRGDDVRAVELVREMLALERDLYRHPAMVGHYTALTAGAWAASVLDNIAPDLRIGASGASDGVAVSLASARRMVGQLLEDDQRAEGRRRALLFERMALSNDCVHIRGSAPGNDRLAFYVVSPLVYSASSQLLEDATERIKQPAADWPSWRTSSSPCRDRGNIFVAMTRDNFVMALEHTAYFGFLQQTEKRLCALALAARIYASQHDESFPIELRDLVPTYIPSVPLDPMTSGEPLKYGVAPSPIVYSAGENGVDEGGSEQPDDPRNSDSRWNRKDLVLHLTRRQRTSPEAFWATRRRLPVPHQRSN